MVKFKVVCERCRQTFGRAWLATYRTREKAEARVKVHSAGFGHSADVIEQAAK